MKRYVSLLNAKKLAVNLLWELTGSLFIAAGIYNFAVQAAFPMTGFSGIALILYRLIDGSAEHSRGQSELPPAGQKILYKLCPVHDSLVNPH